MRLRLWRARRKRMMIVRRMSSVNITIPDVINAWIRVLYCA